MRAIISAGFVAAMLTFSLPAGAMDSMHSSMMMKCATGDPVVGLNTMTKKYMSDDQMKMKTAGMSDSQMHAMMMKNHVKMMCKSKADAMGGTMMMSKKM
jgi:hypothetical protein